MNAKSKTNTSWICGFVWKCRILQISQNCRFVLVQNLNKPDVGWSAYLPGSNMGHFTSFYHKLGDGQCSFVYNVFLKLSILVLGGFFIQKNRYCWDGIGGSMTFFSRRCLNFSYPQTSSGWLWNMVLHVFFMNLWAA